ncbi:hypothetical protein, conserved [Eimeria tenella]|uniref:Transmembrane protein n=1 Tax=Eimeria tenella TaxID=5802 RepID=U6KPB0_EIMTE|nr:hypothetical protein, conserved [Eimeria tenella]CDJ39917.1 hypothetical protein, conserved [Eimeria tenella]|eukprot:XP_013230670.1 hypothetical protein, conserved [Eimeria tenella]
MSNRNEPPGKLGWLLSAAPAVRYVTTAPEELRRTNCPQVLAVPLGIMLLIALAWLGSALTQSSSVASPGAAPHRLASISRLSWTSQKFPKDAPAALQPAAAAAQIPHPTQLPHETPPEAGGSSRQSLRSANFLKPRALEFPTSLNSTKTPTPQPQQRTQRPHSSSSSSAPSVDPPAGGASRAPDSKWHLFSFVQGSPMPNTVIVIFVGSAVVLVLIVVAIISHYALSSRTQMRQGSAGFSRQQYHGRAQQRNPLVPRLNHDVFASVVESHPISRPESFNSLYDLPPGFNERKTPRELEYERRVMQTRLAPRPEDPQREQTRRMDSRSSPRGKLDS